MENERQNQPKKYSLDEYLQLEQVAESRYEYNNGSIVKMGYTSVPHGIIVNNLNLLIGNYPLPITHYPLTITHYL